MLTTADVLQNKSRKASEISQIKRETF